MFTRLFGRKKSRGDEEGYDGNNGNSISSDPSPSEFVVVDPHLNTYSLYPQIDGSGAVTLPYSLSGSSNDANNQPSGKASGEKKEWLSDVPFKLASFFDAESNHDEIQKLLRKSYNLLTQDLLVSLQYDFHLERSVV